MKRLLFALVFAGGYVALAPAASRADDAKPEGQSALFDQLDANKDGKLTRDEIPEDKRRLFDRLLRKAGKSEDSSLTKEEFAKAMKEDAPTGRPEAGPGGPRGPGGDNPEQMFQMLDRKGEGKLTRDNIPEQFHERFDKMLEMLGKGKDASISKEEFIKIVSQFRGGGSPQPGSPNNPQGRPEMMKSYAAMALYKALDTNGDGELSSSEIAAAPEVLKKLADKEGKITMQSLLGDRASSFSQSGRPEGRPEAGKPGEAGNRPGIEMIVKGMISRNDKNGDGKLSKDEVPEFLNAHFDELDSNKDGFLDETELRQGLPRDVIGRMMREGGPRPEGQRPDGERKREAEKKPDSVKKPDSK